MSLTLRIAAIGAVTSLLAACGTMDAGKIASMENKGDSFTQALQQNYVQLGKAEAAEYDWRDADHFFTKAINAAEGQVVNPDAIADRMLPGVHTAELTAARARLTRALDAGGAKVIPTAMAQAQAQFDCWMQEAEENIQPKDIAACKKGFEQAMDGVENALRPQVAAPKPKPAAPPPAIVDGIYIVYFDLDDDRPNLKSGKTIIKVLQDHEIDKPAVVRVFGHTDTSGSSAYNLKLSQARAETIKGMLADGGIPAANIVVSFYGEDDPLRPTADSVKEERNRRVEIEFE